MTLENQSILCISSADWDPIWTRKQQIMSRLPKSNIILYIEPPVTLLSPFKDRTAFPKWFGWLKGIRRREENLFLYSMPPGLPFGYKSKTINMANQWWFALWLRRVIRQMNLKNLLLWTYLPNMAYLIRILDPKLVIYDCVDEFSEYTGLINKEVVQTMERELLTKADLVFVTSPGLYKAKKNFSRNIYYLPNAADVRHFLKANSEDIKVPDELQDLPRPVLGFVGVIHDWVDLDLLGYIARERPEWSLVIIGPVGAGTKVAFLEELPNVYFLGRRDREVLPSYLKGFDVCLNSFKKNALTDQVSPLKLYEYLASGKPVVSVDMPAAYEFKEVIEIAQDYPGFLVAIEKALKSESEAKREKRLAVAKENNWEQRVVFMMEKINMALNSAGNK